MDLRPDCLHHESGWRYNPREQEFNRDCTRCGGRVRSVTLDAAKKLNLPVLKNFIAGLGSGD